MLYSRNQAGFCNRLRCFLRCLRQNKDSIMVWSDILGDGMTKLEHHSSGNILPFEQLFKTDRVISPSVLEERYRQDVDVLYWDADLYIEEDKNPPDSYCMLCFVNRDDIKNTYIDLKNRFLIPQEYIIDRCFKQEFQHGFQMRTWSELTRNKQRNFDLKSRTIDYILHTTSPVFVACDNLELLNILKENENVFYYKRKYIGQNFNLEWDVSLMELITLSKCNNLNVTNGSTFGDTAYLFGDCKQNVNLISDLFAQNDV